MLRSLAFTAALNQVGFWLAVALVGDPGSAFAVAWGVVSGFAGFAYYVFTE